MRNLRTDGPAHCHSGFTLLETIVAVGLMTLLMAGLYSAMTIYFELRMDSYDEIERVQISRTLMRQMTRDVQSVVFVAQDNVSDVSDDDESSETEGGADPETAMSLNTNGIVGTEFDLLLYISRPDRDLNYLSAQELTSLSERSGDLMIVRYFVADTAAGGLASQIADQYAVGTDSGPVGLVRLTGDLYGLSMAIQDNEEQNQLSAAQLQAPEVSAIRFQYYDGTAWQTEWDSTVQNAMPVAIEVTLTLVTAETERTQSQAANQDIYGLGATTHRMIINVPVAEPFVAEASL